MQLKVPGKGTADVEIFPSKVPRPEDIAITGPKFLLSSRKIAAALKGAKYMWAIGGDTGLVLHGVPVDPDRIEIVTTKHSVEMILAALPSQQTKGPETREVRLPKDAENEGENFPVFVRSYYGELDLDGMRVEVHGDKQFKVGEWDWGDPLEFTPEVILVMGKEVPLVPLHLENDLAFGLGWLELARKINTAIERKRHRGMLIPGVG